MMQECSDRVPPSLRSSFAEHRLCMRTSPMHRSMMELSIRSPCSMLCLSASCFPCHCGLAAPDYIVIPAMTADMNGQTLRRSVRIQETNEQNPSDECTAVSCRKDLITSKKPQVHSKNAFFCTIIGNQIKGILSDCFCRLGMLWGTGLYSECSKSFLRLDCIFGNMRQTSDGKFWPYSDLQKSCWP